MKKLQIITILITLLSSMIVYVPRASAGLIIKLPSNLGLSTNLVGHWTMDDADIYWENGTMRDASGNGNTGSFAGAMSTTTAPAIGRLGQALKFDGSNDTIQTPSIDLSSTNVVTVSFWALSNDFSSTDRDEFIEHSPTVVSNVGFDFHYFETQCGGDGSGFIVIGHKGNVGLNTSCYTPPSARVWHHYAAIYNFGVTDPETSLYIDGVLQTATSFPQVNENTGNFGNFVLNIGARNNASNWCDCQMDDVRIYSRALSPSEIRRLYNIGGTLKIGKTDTTSLTSGLVGHWTMDGGDIYESGTKVVDKSGQGNYGTISSGVTPTIGRIGQALNYPPGGNENYYVQVANEANFDFDNSSTFSFSAWIYRNNSGSDMGLFNKQQASADYPGIDFFAENSNNRLSFILAANVPGGCSADCLYVITPANSLTNRAWHHVVVTYSGTGIASGVHIYIDGVDQVLGVNVNTLSSSILNNAQLYIGSKPPGCCDFDGKIDDARVYNRVLSTSEIRRLYNMGGTLKIGKTDTTSLTSGLVGHWTMDDADIYWENGTIRDASGNGNKGSFSGAMGTTTAPAIGRIGQALKFDGSNDLILAPLVTNATQNVTVSTWVNWNGTTAGDQVVVYNGHTGSDGFGIFISDGNCGSGSTIVVHLGGVNCNATASSATLSAKTWTHIAETRDATTWTLYVNGVAQGTGATSPNTPTIATAVGASHLATNVFNGSLDDVRIYSRALSASEINRLYQMGR